MSDSNTQHASDEIKQKPNGETMSAAPLENDKQPTSSGKSAKKPNVFKRLWTKLDMDTMTLILMFKASLPPTIAIAVYQSDSFASVYSTLGYLVAITSVLGMCIMPRGMFIQSMALNLITVCFGAAVCLLMLYCSIQARLHTTPKGAPPTGYNASASAVSAVWLIFQTYLANTLRSALPQFQFPVIIYSIFLCVSVTYGTQFPSMTYAISFMERLLEAFLTGFAIATGVSLFIFPISSRKVVLKEMTGYLNGLGGLLKLQAAYLESMEEWDPKTTLKQFQKQAKAKTTTATDPEVISKESFMTPQGRQLKETLPKILALHTKIPTDLNFAKREIAIGSLSPRDISDLWKQMRVLLMPTMGLSSVIDILQRRAEASGWMKADLAEAEIDDRHRQIENLHQLMKALHGPVAYMSSNINAAFQHTLLTLELIKPPKKKQDEESTIQGPIPGTPGFAEAFKQQLEEFRESKKQTIRDWCHEHGFDLPPDFFISSFINPEQIELTNERERETNQRELFFALYVHHLLARGASAALELVLFAEKMKQDGKLKKNRLIVPGMKTFKKWAWAAFGKEDLHDETSFTADLDSSANRTLDLGESFGKRKDPEHLPPQNVWESIGDVIRKLPHALRSEHSAFGFRVTAATMSVAIICFLRYSQEFFLQNRLLWAMIMVPISMTRTAGQSTFSFSLRILGTAIAMTASYVIWYIVDGKAPGVIVFLWLWIFLAMYIPLKFKGLIVIGIISIVTAILIIGYELQVGVLGVKASESNGQPAYKTYVLGPYRLATVCAGLFVAYFWTIFPYPVTEATELRKDIGAALYMLANNSSVVHETVKARVQKIDGDQNVKGTRAYHLEKARITVFNKLLALLTTLQQNSAFSKYQLRVGGRFPREEYEGLIESIRRVLQYTSLISYSSTAFSASAVDSQWSTDFRSLLQSSGATSHRLTSLLSLLSSSMMHARPLPPYLEIPQHARYLRNMQVIDPSILSISHVGEPEYAAFAVIQICAQCINDEVVKITRHVKTLVGTIDFSFHIPEQKGSDSDDWSLETAVVEDGEDRKQH